jgi:hypothetical protein
MHTSTHAHTHLCTHTHTHAHILMHVPTHAQTHTYAHTHTCAHTAVECFPASGVYGSGTCASCYLPEYLTSSTVPTTLLKIVGS